MAFQPAPPALPPHTVPSTVPPVRMPPRYFEFASPTDSNQRNRNGVSAETIRNLVRQHGNNILIGFDLGRLNPDALRGGNIQDAIPQHAREAFRVAKELGVRLHAYLGGPFGPTGSQFESGEAQFMKESAQRVGIDTSRSGWENEWNTHGWKEATRRQLAVVRQLGFESFELDNLERDSTIKNAIKRDDANNGDTPFGDGPLARAAYVNLFRDVATWGGPDKLMMKNLNPGALAGVEQAMNSGQLRRSNFADFMISEENNRSRWPAVEQAAARMGIQLAPSHNTHAYATSQSYAANLQTEMLRLSNLTGNAAENGWRINTQPTQPPQAARSDQVAHTIPLRITPLSG